jgi:ketosteroid isomerase-like protein
MSLENVDGVKAAWAAVSANDFEGFLEWVDPEVEFTSLVAEADASKYRGHAGVRKWWGSVKETFTDFWAEPIDLRDLGGDQVLAHIRLCGTIRGTKVDQAIWQLLEVKDLKVVSWTIFRTEAEALAAARASSGSLAQRSRSRK